MNQRGEKVKDFGKYFWLYGVLNPKGEDNNKITSFLTKAQLKQCEHYINDSKNEKFPVFINHITTGAYGDPAIPAGHVQFAKVHEKNGQLYIGVILYKNKMGLIAEHMVKDPVLPLNEFSLGQNVIMKKILNEGKEVDIPIGNMATEVSLCYVGDREGTVMSFAGTIDEFMNKMGCNDSTPQQASRSQAFLAETTTTLTPIIASSKRKREEDGNIPCHSLRNHIRVIPTHNYSENLYTKQYKKFKSLNHLN